jgi:phosphohistidine phosphatase SixA
MSRFLKLTISGLLFISFLVILLNAFVSLYDYRNDIKRIYNKYLDVDIPGYAVTPKDEIWANKIMNGGYILHFRHAERDKWIDVQMYDAIESDLHSNGLNGSRFAENEYFSQAVCLNSRGLVQAKAMAEHIQNIKLPFGYVISSPICRSRQTAEIVFDSYDELHRDLVHKGPYNEIESKRIERLKNLYLNIPMEQNKNAVVSAHNSVVDSKMFNNIPKGTGLNLEEGGFHVISKQGEELRLEHTFYYFKDFMRVFYKR